MSKITSSIEKDNRFFDKLAHRVQEYRVGDVEFRIILFHSLSHTRNTSPELHRQPTLEFSMIEKGHIEYFTKNQTISAKPGGVVFIPPGEPHNWRVLERPFLITGFQLAVSKQSGRTQFIQHLQTQARKRNHQLNDFPIFGKVLAQIRKEIKLRPPYFMDHIDCLIRQLLVEFMRHAPLHTKQSLPENNEQARNIIRATIIKEFVKANLSTPLTLSDIADHMNLSIRQLYRIFKEQEAIPLGTYILNSKIESAKYELVETEKLIKEIALDLGFDDINYFCRIFRRKTGNSPSEYRHLYST